MERVYVRIDICEQGYFRAFVFGELDAWRKLELGHSVFGDI